MAGLGQAVPAYADQSGPDAAFVQAEPLAARFTFKCPGDGVEVVDGSGKSVLRASFSQIALPLAVAIGTQQNQPIIYGAGVSLWALKSNELQAHNDSNPDQTKVIVPASICGPIDFTPAYYGTVTIVQPVPVYQVVYQPVATVTVIQPVVAAPGGIVYVVQPGDTLYRIALRYGSTVGAIAAVNGIANVNRIYVGQRLIIP
ncbi:MAG: LysM peptidoglycan-binding domain-containing protein [Anaerolineae bacterium]|nr:LysM peptidoglycan-binding domain-containing protein [Anaerolineae bacterium]